MNTWGAIRKRLNGNDGRWFRINNDILRWYQVVGGLGLVAGILLLKFNTLGIVGPRWLGWAAILGGAVLLSPPWLTPDRVPDVSATCDSDHGGDGPGQNRADPDGRRT
jgi:hypothetical protein